MISNFFYKMRQLVWLSHSNALVTLTTVILIKHRRIIPFYLVSLHLLTPLLLARQDL